MDLGVATSLSNSNSVISHVLSRQAQARPDAPALQWKCEKPLTYKELFETCRLAAGALREIGVSRDDKVLIMLPNSIEAVLSWLSTNLLGAIEVPINIHYKRNFLVHEANNCEAKLAIIHEQYLPRFIEVADQLHHLKNLLIVTDNKNSIIGEYVGEWRLYHWETQLQQGSPLTPVLPDYHDTAAIMYTSGTTGLSKGVVMPYGLGWAFAQAIISIGQLTDRDVYYVCLPLFHGNAQFMQVLPSLIVGAKACIWPTFSASQFLDQVRACGATVTNTLGVMCEFIYRQPVRNDDADNPLRVVFALPTPKDIAENFERRFAVTCVEGYGMTESSVFTYRRLDEPLRLGSAGKPLEQYEVIIVDPQTDEPLPSGQIGEIVVRPKLPGIFMKGYHRMSDKTVEAWRNLWFHTGDAGRMDEEGYLYFVDRIKDAIRRRGENISSQTIESVVNAHPAVLESAAIAVPSEHGAGAEDEIKLCVVLKENAVLDPADLHAYCSDHIPYFAVPRYIEYVSELAKTPNAKLKKNVLRELGITSDTWDREAAGVQLNK
jgi:crotonobetaine/carnitine-CoA ligase